MQLCHQTRAIRANTMFHPTTPIKQRTKQCLHHISMRSPEIAKPSWRFFWKEVISHSYPFLVFSPLLGHVGMILALAEKLQGPISNTAQGAAAKFPPIFPRHYLIDKVAAPCPERATQPGSVPPRYDIMPALAAHASSCLQASSSTLDKCGRGELPQQRWRKITAQLLQAKIWRHLVCRAAGFKLVLAVCCTEC